MGPARYERALQELKHNSFILYLKKYAHIGIVNATTIIFGPDHHLVLDLRYDM